MAKIDIANEIVRDYPDSGYTDAEALKDAHTEQELTDILEGLRAEKEGTSPTPQSDLDGGSSAKTTEETEKDAQRLQEQAAEGKASGRYKLADPDTQYAEGDFTLVGDQAKDFPESPSAQLIERVRSGFIVKA